MQRGYKLNFKCQECEAPIEFSIFDIEEPQAHLDCKACSKSYSFKDEVLRRQLRKFEMLCRQLIESEEILSNTSVGIDIGDKQVEVPYKLLLTRLNSILNLKIGDKPVKIEFRLEPASDIRINSKGEIE